MRQRRVGWVEILLVVAVLALVGQLLAEPIRAWVYRPRAGRQMPAEAELTIEGAPRLLRYWVYLPQEYSTAQKWPLLMYFHGSGLRGNDIDHLLTQGPPAYLSRGNQLPMIVVSPQCAANGSWEPGELLALLDHLQHRFPVDQDRIYICGHSMGGFDTWALACAAPERFAAAVPQCGGGDVAQAARLVNLPIWTFHGEKDTTVPLAESKKMVDAVNAAGGNARLTIYAGKGHSICDLTFFDRQVYEWMLQQRRGPSPRPSPTRGEGEGRAERLLRVDSSHEAEDGQQIMKVER